MQYKTIMLELLEQHPELHDQLRRDRILLETLHQMAVDLKERHLRIMSALQRSHSDIGCSGISSQALEIAVQEMQHQMTGSSDAPAAASTAPDHLMPAPLTAVTPRPSPAE